MVQGALDRLVGAFPLTLDGLIKGYILTAKPEGKSPDTLTINFLCAGGDVFTLKYLLGYSSITMVQNYLKSLSAEDAIRAHERFSPVDNMKLER